MARAVRAFRFNRVQASTAVSIVSAAEKRTLKNFNGVKAIGKSALQERFGKSFIAALQMNGMRRNDDAMKRIAGTKKAV